MKRGEREFRLKQISCRTTFRVYQFCVKKREREGKGRKYVFTQNQAELAAVSVPGFRDSRNILFVFRAPALCAPAEPSIRAGYTDWFRNHRPVKQIDCSGEGIKEVGEGKIAFFRKGKNEAHGTTILQPGSLNEGS